MPHDYILTHSGARVGNGVPYPDPITVDDIVRGLSCIPRFAGQGRRPWSVLQHSLVVSRLLVEDVNGMDMLVLPSPLIVHALLHDAHEAFTGDVPTPFKPDSLREVQRQLDEQIFRSLGVPFDPINARIVARADHCALLAEAVVVGPPALRTSEDVERHLGGRPQFEDVDVVRAVVGIDDPEFSFRSLLNAGIS